MICFSSFSRYSSFRRPHIPQRLLAFHWCKTKTPLILALSLNALCTMGDFRERTRTGNVYFNQRDFSVANWSSKICTCGWVLRALLLSKTSNVQCLDEKLTWQHAKILLPLFSSPLFNTSYSLYFIKGKRRENTSCNEFTHHWERLWQQREVRPHNLNTSRINWKSNKNKMSPLQSNKFKTLICK